MLRVALGWTDSHLHQFIAGGLRYGVPHVDDFDDERDEAAVRLADLPARFGYVYDFGDHWEHDVELLGRGGAEPGCVYGEGTCPPEDCGGSGGYAELLDVLANPNDDEHEHLRSWVGDRLADFDQAATDLLVRQTVGAVPESVRLVLDLTDGGVRLTPGGRLPRAVVRQVQQQRPDWHLLDRPAQLEDDLPPLAALHDLLRSVGLLRLRHGVVYPHPGGRRRPADGAPAALLVQPRRRVHDHAGRGHGSAGGRIRPDHRPRAGDESGRLARPALDAHGRAADDR